MPENSAAPRGQNLVVTVGVVVIALAAVFLVGQQISGNGNGDDASPAAAAGTTTESFGVVTTGEGKITAKPDQLTFTATVTNNRKANATALAKTNHDVRAVTINLKKAGVADADIQTQTLSIRQTYVYGRFNGHYGRHNTGYASTQKIKVLVRKLDDAGKVLGAVTTAAGNAVSIGGVTLTISNRNELVAKARAQAVKQSKAAADALAKAAGKRVGHLEFVQVVVPQRSCCYYGDDRANVPEAAGALATSASVAQSVPVVAGKQDVTVTIQARWALAGK